MLSIFTSKTLWATIFFQAVKLILDQVGVHIPWEIVGAASGGFAVKEGMKNFGKGSDVAQPGS